MNIQEKLKKTSNNFPSTLRHSLGFLPTILLRAIIEDKILDKKDLESSLSPKIFSFETTCLFIDISHFFDNNFDINSIKITENESNITKSKIDFDSEISPEFYYFCLNRYYERLISIITNHGGDVIFHGTGVYAIWPPDKKEKENNSDSNLKSYIFEDKNIIEENNKNLCLRAVQCAIEIQKNSIMEIKHGCSFISNIGCSMGECKFIIFQGLYNKYDYIVLGNALINSCNCALKGQNGGEIILDNKIYEYIQEFIKYKEFYIDGIKYCTLIDMKNKENSIKNNKATMNLIKNNFSLEEISMNSSRISRFNHDIIYFLFQRNIFDEKWLKEIKGITIVLLRLKMNKKDLDSPSKLQEIYILFQEICIKNGGNIHKLTIDNKGILFLLTFGILSKSSGCNELKGTLSSIELSSKLKKINVFPFIGITSGNLFCGLCGTIGNRREYSVIGGSFINAFIAMEKAETMYGDKKSGNDNILLDEKTMNMIDGKIPCKFWKRVRSSLGFDINLFVPLKLSSLLHVHRENNLFPLIGCHLICSDNDEYQLDEDLIKEDNIIYFEENVLKDYVKTLNEHIEKKSKIKLISVTGPTGCGKTMLLNKSLKTFFQMNPKLKEILCNSNYGDDYPFIFSSNLTFTINNNILLENDIKEYRGLQLIIKDIFTILYNEELYKKEIIDLIFKNNCEMYIELLHKIFEINDLMNNIPNIENIKQKSTFNKNSYPYLNSFIYDLLSKYKQFLESLYEEKLSKYLSDIPLIILIEDYNICDENTKDFINYYLKKENKDVPFIFITAQSFHIFPCYNFLTKKEKDPFYDYKDDSLVKKYNFTPYDTKEKINQFVISILYELRKARINAVSEPIIHFLLYKTFNGIPQFIKELILSLYDNNLIYVSKTDKELVADDKFKAMIKYNDFTELKIPEIIVKKVNYIIDNYLDNLDIYILKLASIIGNMFDLTKLKQAVLLDNSANSSMNSLRDNCNSFLYERLCSLEENYIIEILYDINIKKKNVICKFSVPFLREILYQRTPSEYRNQIHYIIGRLVNVDKVIKNNEKIKYMDEIMELGILEKHLKYSQISIHDNFLNGKLSIIQLNDDNYLNINNLKTLIIRQICAKIKSIKISDDKNNMIKAGYIYKKSDGKITWEYRYFVLTTNRVLYFYKQEDYIENKAPLGIFYLQNLFDIKLMIDGFIGGKKNIISLVVNEWIKKGEVMKPRVYYLSVEEREETYKWVITFSILKIKAFYEIYCSDFGYINFPIYNQNKIESFQKQKKNKFNFPHKVGLKQEFKKRRDTKRHSIYSPYLSLGKIENKYNTVEFEKFIIKQYILYVKFLVSYSLSHFLGNIQIGLSQDSSEYEDSKLFTKEEGNFDFSNPVFYEKIMEKEQEHSKRIHEEIEEVTQKYKADQKTNSLYSSNRNNYTEKQKNFFKKYYLKQESIKYLITPNMKKLKGVVEVPKLVKDGKFILEKDSSNLSFTDLEEPELDQDDYLKYLDYTDNDGKLKLQYSKLDESLKTLKKVENDNEKNNKKESSPILSALKKQNKKNKRIYYENEESDQIKSLNERMDDKHIKFDEEKLASNVKESDIPKLFKLVEDTPKEKKEKINKKNIDKNKSTKKKNKKNKRKNSIKEKKEIEIKSKKVEKVINQKIEKEDKSFDSSENSKKSIKINDENLNTNIITNSNLNTNNAQRSSKNSTNNIDYESGKFQSTSTTNFKDLLIQKLTEENNKKIISPIKGKEYLYEENSAIEKISEKDSNKNIEESFSLKNNSGRFVFTLNGDNEKSEKIHSNSKEKEKEVDESEEKSEKSETTKKEMTQEEENENTKKKKDEENEVISSSTIKKDNLIIHNSNVIKEYSINSMSSIDNNLESTKYINGRNFDSINKLLADIGSRRRRRKSNITTNHLSKNLFNDMFSISSTFSNNAFNNNIGTRRNSNFISKFYRCNSTKNIIDKNNFSIPIILNNLKNINNEKSDNNFPKREESLTLINKLKNLKVSLDNERTFSNILKTIKFAKNNNNNNNDIKIYSPRKEFIRSWNTNSIKNKSSFQSRDINTISTKSTGSNIHYPNVYYINQDNNLHKNTHISTIFSKLKHDKKK